MILFFGTRKIDEEDEDKEEGDVGMIKDFEKEFIDLLTDYKFADPSLKVYVSAARSYDDVVSNDTDSDLQLFFVGYMMVGVYVAVMLGKFNQVSVLMVRISKKKYNGQDSGNTSKGQRKRPGTLHSEKKSFLTIKTIRAFIP